MFQYVSCQKSLLEDQQRELDEDNLLPDVMTKSKKHFEKNEQLMHSILEIMKTWIGQFLTNKLLSITDELQVMFSSLSSNYFENNPFILYHRDNQEMIEYSSLADRQYYQNMKSVSFEFVKAISFVLLLDNSLKDSVLVMRRLLLAQVSHHENNTTVLS